MGKNADTTVSGKNDAVAITLHMTSQNSPTCNHNNNTIIIYNIIVMIVHNLTTMSDTSNIIQCYLKIVYS